MNSVGIFSLILAVSFCNVTGTSQWEDAKERVREGIENRIVGGDPAKYEQFPYQARLVLTKKVKEKLANTLCGGVLISNKIVLTAGHCVRGAVGGYVFLGTTNLKNKEESRVILQLNEKSFLEHQNHNPKAFENDIGMVILPNPVKFTMGIRPIRLPRLSEGSLENYVGIASGFGKTGDKEPPSMQLLYAKRRISPMNFCRNWFPYNFRPQMHICLDGNKKSTCLGDSGGPLVVKEQDGYYSVVGVTSYGKISCEMGAPTVFTRISAYLYWINKHTGIPIRR